MSADSVYSFDSADQRREEAETCLQLVIKVSDLRGLLAADERDRLASITVCQSQLKSLSERRAAAPEEKLTVLTHGACFLAFQNCQVMEEDSVTKYYAKGHRRREFSSGLYTSGFKALQCRSTLFTLSGNRACAFVLRHPAQQVRFPHTSPHLEETFDLSA